MKVAHIMAPSPVGGAEQVVLDLTGALAAGGVEVHLVPILDEGAEDHPFLSRIDDTVRVHPLFLPPRRYAMERREVRSLVAQENLCMVHTHGYRADVVSSGAAAGVGAGRVTTVHGFTGGGVRNRLYEWAQRRAFRQFDAVVAVSRTLADELREEGISDARLHTIPNCRRPPAGLLDRVQARTALGLSVDGFHVGWIGRLSQEKGPDVMLEALGHLDGAVPGTGFQTIFIGEGRLRSGLEARASALSLDQVVRFLGRVPDAAEVLPAFDVVVLSSRTEGTPIVALEAMMAGVPLVATRVGGVPDLVGSDAALLVPPEDPEALASAVAEVSRNPQAAESRARRAKARAQEVSSLDSWAERYMQVYEDVATALKGRG